MKELGNKTFKQDEECDTTPEVNVYKLADEYCTLKHFEHHFKNSKLREDLKKFYQNRQFLEMPPNHSLSRTNDRAGQLATREYY